MLHPMVLGLGWSFDRVSFQYLGRDGSETFHDRNAGGSKTPSGAMSN